MPTQDYKNHRKIYVPHHLVYYPVIGFLLVFAIRNAWKDQWNPLWLTVAALAFVAGWLSFMMRQHYALTLQDRVVRLEMRLRYFQLTGNRLEPLEKTLGFSRIAALRFASDEELVSLVERSIRENLRSSDIKRSIRNWIADDDRV